MKRHLADDHQRRIIIQKKWRLAIIATRFNGAIVEALRSGAQQCLMEQGVDQSHVATYRVPGCFELPLMAQCIADLRYYDALICVGAVIRGETPHFEYVAAECSRGIAEVARAARLPVLFGVLTTNNVAQAWARAAEREHNSGWNAARAALEMLEELGRLKDLAAKTARESRGE